MDTLPIQKKLIQPGKGEIGNHPNDTKIKFHYITRTTKDEVKTLDDSHNHATPMELIIGKKFKFEPWEECLQTMANGEISSFTVDKKLSANYPLVSKSLRDIYSGKPASQASGCCGMMAMGQSGLGYDDLNQLLAEPQDLTFILEVLDIELPGSYKKDAWVMSNDERECMLPRLKEEGNKLYLAGDVTGASKKYEEALGHLERLLLQAQPGSEEQKSIEEQKIPFLLNYSQCQLSLSNYYPVIEQTTQVLKHQPDNNKALFRRAKANHKVWRIEEARADFRRVLQLEPNMAATIKKLLAEIEKDVKLKDAEDKKKLQGKLFS